MHILSGKTLADTLLRCLRERLLQRVVVPVFTAVLVGNDTASHIYVNLKEKAALLVGIDFRKIILPETTSHEEVLHLIVRLNNDVSVHGILVQMPLPKHIRTQEIIDAIDPKKDVDGFHPENIRLFLQGEGVLVPVFPRAVMELVKAVGIPLQGKRAVVIGNSDIFGQMMLKSLLNEDIAGVFVRHDRLDCNRAQILSADIVVTACGIPCLITGDTVKSGAIIIDGGITKVGEKVTGDVDILSMHDKDVWVSPVPGGVGPVTIACLLENVTQAAIEFPNKVQK